MAVEASVGRLSAPSRHREAIPLLPARYRIPLTGDRPFCPPTEIRRTLHDCMHKAHSKVHIFDSNNALPTHKYATTSACGVLRARRTHVPSPDAARTASTACDRTVRAPVTRPPPERLCMRCLSACPTGVPLRPSQNDLAAVCAA